MKVILNLMIKVLVIPFYRNHAGVLFFVFFLMFGIVESSQIVLYHTSLIDGMLGSEIFLLIVLMIWLLYQLKSLHFMITTSLEDTSLFLSYLSLLPAAQSFYCFLVISFLNFLPVFAYTIVIYVIGIQHQFYGSLGIIFIFQLLLWLMNAWALNYTIRKRHLASWFTMPSLNLPYQRTQVGINAGYLFKHEKSSVILSKIFSITLIYLVKETLVTGDDFRIIGITWLFALLSHTYLTKKLKAFEDKYLNWARNLPISSSKTFLSYFSLYSLLMLPELLLLTGSLGKGLTLFQFALLPIFSGAFLVAIHSYLFKPDRDPEKFVTSLFWLFLICFMLVLSKMIWIITSGLLLISFLQFSRRFFLYEALGDK